MPSPLLDDDVAEPRKASATFAANCARCAWKNGRINAATIADHIERHGVISKNSSSASFSRFV